MNKIGRNDTCPCGSGLKYKRCCLRKSEKNRSVDILTKIEAKYGHLKDSDIIENFALGKLGNDIKSIEIQDFNLNESQKKLFNRVSEIYSSFTKISDLYNMYLSDFADFNKKFSELERGDIHINQNNNGGDFNRKFIHILTSARLFLTFMENDIKKRYGNNSKQLEKWKTSTSEMYDNSFSYRFAYYLRNYTQHSGLPISTISATIIDNDPHKKCKCKMTLNSNNLLESGYNWNSKIKKELEAINGDIDVYDILNGLMNSLIHIYGNTNSIFIENYDGELKQIEKQLKTIYSNKDQPFLAKISKYDLAHNPRNYTLVPLQGLREIVTIYVELSKMGLVQINYS